MVERDEQFGAEEERVGRPEAIRGADGLRLRTVQAGVSGERGRLILDERANASAKRELTVMPYWSEIDANVSVFWT